jgi:hypothetical protein
MKKFQATIQFEMNDEFMTLVPPHRTYINKLIEEGVIDQYAVSMESQQVWITINAEDKIAVERFLADSPLHKYWTYQIDELFLFDGKHYRLPSLQYN